MILPVGDGPTVAVPAFVSRSRAHTPVIILSVSVQPVRRTRVWLLVFHAIYLGERRPDPPGTRFRIPGLRAMLRFARARPTGVAVPRSESGRPRPLSGRGTAGLTGDTRFVQPG